jgi:hypothetical protein
MGDSARQPGDFAVAFDAALGELQVRIESACADERAWAEGVRAGIGAAFDWVAAEPGLAQLLTNDALAAGSPGFERYERMVGYIAGLLAPGREQAAHGERLPNIVERAMASGVTMLVAQRLALGQGAELPALAAEATEFVLTPYLGGIRARRVALG